MRVLVFGDSITQGYWDTEGGWVERLRKHYDSLQITDFDERDDPTIFNLGVSADNSANILQRIESETVARTYRDHIPMLIVQIGINDSSTDTLPAAESVSLPIEQYEKNLRTIIEKTKPLCSKIIFVGSSACDESRTTPTSWGEYYYTNEAIKKYENKMRDITADVGIPFIPLYDRFATELAKGRDLLTDGLHPNNDGHAFICERLLPDLTSLLT